MVMDRGGFRGFDQFRIIGVRTSIAQILANRVVDQISFLCYYPDNLP
jgi:hypothetical protein